MPDKTIKIDFDENEDTSTGYIITQPFSPSDIRITNPPMNLGDLIDMIKYGWIDFEADYQREDNLWDEGKQSRLIESGLLGLRLPAFYFEEVSKKQWRIIDGLQRCSAIRNFCVDQTLSLTDLEFLKFNGWHYSDFDFELTRDLRMLPITVNILQPGVPDDVKYILFKRLNTGGVELKPQEIRNSMFQGPAINLVRHLASSDAFIIATSNKIPTRRKQDQDFVSRYLAFYLLDFTNYQPDIERFINKAMQAINSGHFTDRQLSDTYYEFYCAMDLAKKVFGKTAFRKFSKGKPGPINKALFEIIAVTFAKLSPTERHKIEDKSEILRKRLLDELYYNEKFSYSLSTTTGRPDNVKLRFTTFMNMVNDVLSND